MSKDKERLIKAISKVTGIREGKIEDYSRNNDVLNLLTRPKTIDPTKLQMEKIGLLNEFLVNYSITKEFAQKKEISFTNSMEVGEYFKHLIGNKKDKEVFMCAYLDRNNQLIKVNQVSEGTLSMAVVFPREVVKDVLDTKCKSVIFSHNHPSGNTTPSNEDISLTQNLVNIITPLGVKVIDHLIVGNDITSLRDMGAINNTVDTQFTANANKDSYSIGKEYYNSHEETFIESLSTLTDIDQDKIRNYMNNISRGEDPANSKESLNLNTKELTKLKLINELLKNYNSQSNINEYKNKIGSPFQMAELFKDRIKDDGKEDVYLMLFNTKLVLLGIEKISSRVEENIVLYPKEILSKILAYEANSISLIHTNSQANNEKIDLAMKLAQNTFNITNPLQLKVIDYLVLNNGTYTSLKEKGLMPYTVIGAADYKKVNVGIDRDYQMEADGDEYDMEI